ncbi:hypothetical protein HX109_01540 [Galbibacter sp. BG1]|uniref:hypothetical protein n=1 Tax=Galbibacter sp. BG1 TaxID=1170699 RepID=UPI0015BA37E0|nr:hypothetical protein [Galbibacter sp. BG1]QLE00310.1 hypothetical protein HX109_01540 [Galbibacter sp. BG1]
MKYLIILCLIIIFSSCHSAKYTSNSGSKGILDFTEGKWIINDAVCTNCDKTSLEAKMIDFFKECIKDSLVLLDEERKMSLIKDRIPFEPSKSELKAMAEGTNAAYLITLKGEVIKEEFGGIGYEPDQDNADYENISASSIAFYDLKTQTQIHFVNTRGGLSVSKSIDDEDGAFAIAPSSINILNKATKMNIKILKKNCICK